MSPLIELEITNPDTGNWEAPKTIADLPDVSGTFETTEGSIEIDLSGLQNPIPQITLKGEFLKGRKRLSGGPEFGPEERRVSISRKKKRGVVYISSVEKITVTLK